MTLRHRTWRFGGVMERHRARRIGALVVALLPLAAACGSGPGAATLGPANAIAVIAVDSIWEPLGDEIVQALEPRIFTVRDERGFEVGSVSPLDPNWLDLRRVKNVVAVGRAGDSWIADILGSDSALPSAPAVIVRHDVWARGQLAVAVVVQPGTELDAVRGALPEVLSHIEDEYDEYTHERMYVSGRNTALQDTLEQMGGFSMLFPNVYRWERDGQAFVFTNHSELTATIFRTFMVVARPGAPAELDPEALLAWRDSLGAATTEPPQVTLRDRIETRTLTGWPGAAIQVQGVWRSGDESYPAAGPFISRAYVCPASDQTFYVDAWLYLPDVDRAKHEYMIQLNTLLDSFRCAGMRSAADAS